MPQQSAIEWTDATWNPVTGCSKVSQGCKNCYAEAYFARPYPGRKFTDVRIHPERLDWPLRWRGSPKAKAEGRPSRIFVNSMSDLFHENVPTEFIHRVIDVAQQGRHIYQVLTKRPARLKEFAAERFAVCEEVKRQARNEGYPEDIDAAEEFQWPLPNVWLGVSVEDQRTADERIPILLQTPAAVRWVSYEPALGPVDLGYYIDHAGQPSRYGINWVVAGGESGPHARPSHPDWFRSVRDQCAAAGVPFFFKQHGAWIHQDGYPGSQGLVPPAFKIHEWPDGTVSWMVGKKNSGRLLDGREHSEFPEMQEVANSE